MKNVTLFLFILILTVYCSNNDDDNNTNLENYTPEINEGIAAKIDSYIWNAFNYSATLRNKQIIISGLDTNLGTISITINDTISNKTYELNNHSPHWAVYSVANTDLYTTFGNPYAGGMVYLKEFNHDSMYISGNFIFYVYNSTLRKTKAITQGSFQKISITKESITSNTIKMKMNGINFTSKTVKASIDNEKIVITGINDKGTKLSIQIFNRLQGVYFLNNLSVHQANVIMYLTPADTLPYSTKEGTSSGGLVIISNNVLTDSLINGSFILSLYRNNDKKSILLSEGYIHALKVEP